MNHKKKPARRPTGPGRGERRNAPGQGERGKPARKKGIQKSVSRRTAPRSADVKAAHHRDDEKAAPPIERRPRARPKKAPAEAVPSLGEPPKRKRGPVASNASSTKVDEGRHDVHEREPEARPFDSAHEGESAFDDSHFADPFTQAVDVGLLGIGSPFYLPDMEGSADTDEASPDSGGSSLADDPSVEMRIREIEERLDGLMASAPHDDLDMEPPPEPEVVAPSSADTAVDAAREVLQSDYYRQKWGRGSLRARTQEVDEFGMDPDYEEKLRPVLDFMFKKYFRVEVEGVRNIPSEGRAVIVANHSGALPFDGVMLREAIRQRHSGRSDLRWLAEDFSFYLPFLGVALNRIGAVRACPENAERLLAKEHLLGVFPEGAEGIKKLYKNRYTLQRFGRGGFVRLCLKTHSPIIPCAIVGAEETNPILYRFDNLSKLLGLDYLPITPTFPLLGPFGLLPAPTKWKIIFGEPISMGEYGPQAEKDHVLVGRLSERVRSSINDLLETSLRRRKSIWL